MARWRTPTRSRPRWTRSVRSAWTRSSCRRTHRHGRPGSGRTSCSGCTTKPGCRSSTSSSNRIKSRRALPSSVRPRRSPSWAADREPQLARQRVDPRDAALHRVRDHAVRRVLHGVLLRPRRQRDSVAAAALRAAGVRRGSQHRDPRDLELHDALGVAVDQARKPRGPAGRPAADLPDGPRLPVDAGARVLRCLIASIVYFGAIVVASVAGGTWVGLGVFIALTAVVIGWWARARREERPPRTEPRPHAAGERRILVIANETVGGQTLRSAILEKSLDVREEVLVVTPALNSPLKHWVSDEDGARAAAQERLDASLVQLAAAGVEARGEVGDGDPIQAMEDALRTFGADEIIISTHPPGRSNWLERSVVERARERFAVPITHIVVDLEAEREDVRS